jgi:hypothetical protein
MVTILLSNDHVIMVGVFDMEQKTLWRCTACSLGLSATSQQYFSLGTNQPPTTSQQYSSLRTNQHQPSPTSQPNRLVIIVGVFDTEQKPLAKLIACKFTCLICLALFTDLVRGMQNPFSLGSGRTLWNFVSLEPGRG